MLSRQSIPILALDILPGYRMSWWVGNAKSDYRFVKPDHRSMLSIVSRFWPACLAVTDVVYKRLLGAYLLFRELYQFDHLDRQFDFGLGLPDGWKLGF